jgi:hypothetical protein
MYYELERSHTKSVARPFKIILTLSRSRNLLRRKVSFHSLVIKLIFRQHNLADRDIRGTKQLRIKQSRQSNSGQIISVLNLKIPNSQ